MIKDLEGMPTQFEAPSTADGYARGIKAVQGIVKEQGQVMAMALDNNQNLWNTNKRLRSELEQAKNAADRATLRANVLQQSLDRLATPDAVELTELRERVRVLEQANTFYRDEMTRQLDPGLDTDQRKAALEALKQQKNDLFATGLVPTDEELEAQERATQQPS